MNSQWIGDLVVFIMLIAKVWPYRWVPALSRAWLFVWVLTVAYGLCTA
jgi:hypothetical protein